MATRMYLSGVLTGLTPTPQGAWDDTALITRGSLSKTKDVSNVNSALRIETNASTTWDVIGLQMISAALDQAQTISGTFDLVLRCNESALDCDMHLHIHLWVRDSGGGVRGTLLSDVIDATEMPTTTQGVQFPQQTLSSLACSVGDRIVLEIGYQAQNGLTASRSGSFAYGANGATDLTAGDTDSTHPGWCEFGTTITDAETRVNWQEQWYLGAGSQDATAIPPLIRGGWTATASAAGPDALRTTTPGVASGSIALSTGATTQNLTRLLVRFVTPPLNAGTLPASNFRITGLTLENATDQDIVWCVYVYLMKANGDVRTVLLNLAADPDADNEWPITTAAGRQSDQFSVAQTAITQDDRVVIEVGGKQLGTPAAAGNITMRQGGTGADAQVGDTDTTKPTWVIFDAAAAANRNQGAVWVGL